MGIATKRPRGNATISGIVRRYPLTAYFLPRPSEEWSRRQLPPLAWKAIGVFTEQGVVKKIGETDHGNALYRTTDVGYGYVEELDDPTAIGKCIHSGVRNVRGDGYTCLEPTCDVRFSREVAEEIIAKMDS